MKKNKQKGFTLIELLVVVAITGILASVGVVAYNGYTTSAQRSAAASNHNSVVKWIQNEYQKCSIGESTAMNANLTCVDDAGLAADAAAVAAATITSQQATTAKMDNPYTKTAAVQNTGTEVPTTCSTTNRGQIVITTDSDNVVVTTCQAAADGDTTNLLSDTIALN